MANDSTAEAEKREQQPSNSITVGTIALAVLIITIVAVTSLLNNQKISALETQYSQLEASLQILQQETAAKVTKPVNLTIPETEEATIEPPKAGSKTTNFQADMVALVHEHNDKFKGVEAQLQTLKGEIMTARYQLNEQIKAQKRQTAQLVTSLKANLIALVQEQNDKLKGLQTSNQETAEVLKQHDELLKVLDSKLTQLDTSIVVLAKEQDDKFNGLTAQLETTTISLKQQNDQTEQLADQVTQLKADIATQAEVQNKTVKVVEEQLQSLTKEKAVIEKQKSSLDHQLSEFKTSLKADMVTLAQDQDDQLKGLEAQLQTLKGETMTTLYQQNEQVKAVVRQVTQLETSSKADRVALAQEQNDKFKAVESQLQTITGETRAALSQQDEQLKTLVSQATSFMADIKIYQQAQDDKLNGLTTQLQTVSEETGTSIKQLSQQATQLETDMATLAQDQNDKLNGLEAQLQTLRGETTSPAESEVAPAQEQSDQVEAQIEQTKE